MAAERLAMRNIKEILKLKLLAGVGSSRAISRAAKCGKTTVNEYLALARAAGISSWDQVKDLDEAELERRHYRRFPSRCRSGSRSTKNFETVV